MSTCEAQVRKIMYRQDDEIKRKSSTEKDLIHFSDSRSSATYKNHNPIDSPVNVGFIYFHELHLLAPVLKIKETPQVSITFTVTWKLF